MNKILFSAILAVPSAFAMAQLSSVGPFTGDHSEGFESFTNSASAGHYQSMSIFGGFGTLDSSPLNAEHMYVFNPGLSVTWGLGPLGLASVNSGAQAVGFEDVSANPSGNQNGVITFSSTVTSFGGYFALENSSPAVLRFLDNAGAQIGTDQLLISGTATPAWQGWSSTVGIKSVQVLSTDNYLVMDDLQINTVPEPASMAALGLGALALLRRKRK